MRQIILSCLFLVFLSSCGEEKVDENKEIGASEIVTEETDTSLISEVSEDITETLSGAVLETEVVAEEVTEENTETGTGEIVKEEREEVAEVADISEDTSGGQFIFKTPTDSEIKIYPIEHATAVVEWDDVTIYGDPANPIEGFESPDFVFITHEDEGHFSTGALDSVLTDDTMFVTTQAVFDKLESVELQEKAIVMANGDVVKEGDFTITAVPAYNTRPEAAEYHPQGVGNGYIFEKDGFRVYFSGDSDDTPEMKALQDIDIAFVAMKLPFAMGVQSAANATLEFAPTKVFPYNYKIVDGLSDIKVFKAAVEAGNPEIEVLLGDWYSE